MTLPIRRIDTVWLLLMAITIGNAVITETVEPSLLIIVVVAISLAFKGWMVVGHFMELKNANAKIRAWMNAYFIVIPLLVIIIHAFPEWIASMTTLR